MPDRIGKYEVIEAIGRGGFATVYKARDPLMKRVVAVKICTDSDEDLRRRFLREAEIAGSLDHPNIVRGFDCGFDEAGVYLVEEYLDGEDLAHKIRSRRPLSYRNRLAILIEVAHAISYAHSKGVYHRDLKPGNIRVLDNGHIKLMDFGIAKMSTSQTPLTKVGTVLGTAGYVAPEQVLGRPIDHRVDIFAFGALAHELFTYRRPFTGQNVRERLHSVLEVDPGPIRAFWPECPSGLDAAVARCLEKDPEARYASFGEVIADLLRVQAELVEAEEAPTAMSDEPPPIDRPAVDPEETPRDGLPALASPVGDSPTVVVSPVPPPPKGTAAPARTPGPALDATVIVPVEAPNGLSAAPVSPAAPSMPPLVIAAPPAAKAIPVTAPTPASDAPRAAPPPPPPPSAPPQPAAAQHATSAQPLKADARPSAPIDSSRRAQSRRALLIAATTLVGVLAAAVAIWSLMRAGSRRDERAEGAAASIAPAAVATSAPVLEAPAATSSGRVVVDASPWGEVVAVIATDGKPVDTPPRASTPMLLTLPPGDYEVKVARPGDVQEPRSCRVTVTESGLERCRVELARVTGRQYFKESGWWE
jgi:serine/threonine-protein kinase